MLFNLLYLLFFLVLGVLSIYSITAGWRSRAAIRANHPSVRPHPELLDRQGRMIRDPLLVVRVTPRDADIRSRLEAIYEKSPDSDERQQQN